MFCSRAVFALLLCSCQVEIRMQPARPHDLRDDRATACNDDCSPPCTSSQVCIQNVCRDKASVPDRS